MPHLRPFLLLLIAGLVSTSVLPHNPAGTDSLGDFGTTSISAREGIDIVARNSWTARSASADDRKQLEGSRPSDQGTPSDDTPMVSLVRDRSSDLGAPLQKRGFNSPHDRRAFVIAVASNIFTSASWAFEMWITDPYTATIWRGGDFTGSTNLADVGVTLPRLSTIYNSENQFRGSVDFLLSGFIGVSEVVVKFTAEVFASEAAMTIMSMITPPTCTVAGASVEVSSWTFNDA